MVNFVFKFITFRYCVNKVWSSKRLNDNVQLANSEKPLFSAKMWDHMNQLIANLALKFSICCYHSNRGSSDTNFTYTVKLRPHKRMVWCKHCGSVLFTKTVIANFLLKFTMTTRVGLQKLESQ